MNHLVLTSAPQGRHPIAGFPLRESQLKGLADRPLLFMGHDFGLHTVDVVIYQAPNVAEIIATVKSLVEQIIPDFKGLIDPTVRPGPVFFHPVAVRPGGHCLYSIGIVPDSHVRLSDGHALTASVRPAGDLARDVRAVDLMLLLAGSDTEAEDLFTSAAEIPSRTPVTRYWVPDRVSIMGEASPPPQTPQQRMPTMPSYMPRRSSRIH